MAWVTHNQISLLREECNRHDHHVALETEAKICSPLAQLMHVLRHTFVSHFMANGGNILDLQRMLGHTDFKMTMRYAHFAPAHLEHKVKFNP